MHLLSKFIICIFFYLIATIAHAAQPPVLLFSDLISAPGAGWSSAEPNKGAVITVWGRNLGNTRGNSFITVNGVQLGADTDYMDAWGKRNNPVPFLESITFRLNSSIPVGNGTITVSVNGAPISNALPFRVNNSNIYFIDVNASGSGSGTFEDPWSDLVEYIGVMQPGDVGYFRGGTYDQKYNGGKSVIWVRSAEPSGTEQDPIGFVAYPNEDVHMDGITNGDLINFNKGILVDSRYVTVSKFRVSALTRAIDVADYSRIIGNDAVGAVPFRSGSGAGIIHVGQQAPKIYGNATHGSRSGNRLDHAIYIDGCQDEAGGDIAYNYSYDNSFDRGPHFVDNHQESRCSSNAYMKSNHWHHNVISCESSTSRGIGIYDLSWDPGEANEPEPAYVYNNLIVGCGDGFHGAMYHNNGHAVFFNNTVVGNKGKGLQIDGGEVLSSTVINNVFVQSNSTTETCIDFSAGGTATVNNNSYFGGCAPYTTDLNAVIADPKLQINTTAYRPMEIDSNSPLINTGSNSVTGIVTDDFNSQSRPSGAIDIGAVEYLLGPNPPGNVLIQ